MYFFIDLRSYDIVSAIYHIGVIAAKQRVKIRKSCKNSPKNGF